MAQHICMLDGLDRFPAGLINRDPLLISDHHQTDPDAKRQMLRSSSNWMLSHFGIICIRTDPYNCLQESGIRILITGSGQSCTTTTYLSVDCRRQFSSRRRKIPNSYLKTVIGESTRPHLNISCLAHVTHSGFGLRFIRPADSSAPLPFRGPISVTLNK